MTATNPTTAVPDVPAPTPLSARAAKLAVQARGDVTLALLDAVLAAAAYLAVSILRFDGSIPHKYWVGFQPFVILAVLASLGSSWMWGLYGQMWLHASVQEARRVVVSGLTACAALLAAVVAGAPLVPRSVVVGGSMLAMLFMGATRFQSRLFAFRRTGDFRPGARVVVLGAGATGASLVREMQRDPHAGVIPVAVLDDDYRKTGRSFAGVPVVGAIDDLKSVAARFEAQQAVLAIADAPQELVRRAADAAEEARIPLKVVPSVSQLVLGRVRMRDVRDVAIEDLLGRQQIETDLAAVHQLLCGRRVLITGAGGSIGAEIARQVSQFEPAELCVLDHDETHLHDAVARLATPGRQILADIRDGRRMHALFEQLEPEIVFHAAAHKHVPVLEDHPAEAVRTNVVGTHNLLVAARAVDTARFVFISTDKAVRPTSVMGASKWFGEQLVLAAGRPRDRWCAVRFGNVLGSRGSVIPTFARQIAGGGPVTVTDPRMTRYFMSVQEAVQLVLQASEFSHGGEIFMLEMGDPVNIHLLAQRMIRLSGFVPDVDIPIVMTGPRRGEKLHEELAAPDEQGMPTNHPSIIALRSRIPGDDGLMTAYEELRALADEHDHRVGARQLSFASGGAGATTAADGNMIDLTAQEQAKKERVWNPSTL